MQVTVMVGAVWPTRLAPWLCIIVSCANTNNNPLLDSFEALTFEMTHNQPDTLFIGNPLGKRRWERKTVLKAGCECVTGTGIPS